MASISIEGAGTGNSTAQGDFWALALGHEDSHEGHTLRIDIPLFTWTPLVPSLRLSAVSAVRMFAGSPERHLPMCPSRRRFVFFCASPIIQERISCVPCSLRDPVDSALVTDKGPPPKARTRQTQLPHVLPSILSPCPAAPAPALHSTLSRGRAAAVKVKSDKEPVPSSKA